MKKVDDLAFELAHEVHVLITSKCNEEYQTALDKFLLYQSTLGILAGRLFAMPITEDNFEKWVSLVKTLIKAKQEHTERMRKQDASKLH